MQQDADPSASPDTLIERWRMAVLIAQLPDDEARMLRMRFHEGLSQSEIAERTGIPLGTVKTYMVRGLRRLQGPRWRTADEPRRGHRRLPAGRARARRPRAGGARHVRGPRPPRRGRAACGRWWPTSARCPRMRGAASPEAIPPLPPLPPLAPVSDLGERRAARRLSLRPAVAIAASVAALAIGVAIGAIVTSGGSEPVGTGDRPRRASARADPAPRASRAWSRPTASSCA